MNLLITGAFPLNDDFKADLTKLGWSIHFLQQEKDPVPCPQQYEVIICNGLFLHHDIAQFTNLKFIQLTSAGYDRVPMDFIKEHNIQIYNARGVYSIPMAEFALCGVLQLYKQSRFFMENQKAHIWEKHRDIQELHGKTVCIVGCGNVGQECAKRFFAMGCHVIGVDLYPVQSEWISKVYPLAALHDALGGSDVVVLTLPLTTETRHLINQQAFDAMKHNAVLVNIARGGIVDTNALIGALETEQLSGAVLDVFEEEPLSEDSPFWDMENMVVTPHNSFISNRNRYRLERLIQTNLMEHFV